MRIKVRVPASTSNLGPGFDCLGLALGLYNELSLEALPGRGLSVAISGEGEKSLPRDGSNLMVRAARLIAGPNAGRLAFKAVNRIPLARGLGSSAAAVLAGLCAANELFRRPRLTRGEILNLALEFEPHPDNLAASLYGGLMVSWLERGCARTAPLRAHPRLAAAVCVPSFELSTKDSRAVLPPAFRREDAVFNLSRAVMLGSALERGAWELLGLAMEDRLHQPLRAPLVRGFKQALEAGRARGRGACLSGAGPSVLSLGASGRGAKAAAAAMRRAFARKGVRSAALILPVDREGVLIR